MKKEFLALIILYLLCFSCSTKESFEVENTPTTSISNTATERHEYWPLENEKTREDTVLHLDDQYHVILTTRSLNDSAAIHTAIDDMGEIIVHAHNWETEVEILKNQHPFFKTALTRDIFNKRDEAKELRHSGASFQKYENGEFLFGVDACIPDTDVCDSAVVAVDKKGQVRLIKFIEETDE